MSSSSWMRVYTHCVSLPIQWTLIFKVKSEYVITNHQAKIFTLFIPHTDSSMKKLVKRGKLDNFNMQISKVCYRLVCYFVFPFKNGPSKSHPRVSLLFLMTIIIIILMMIRLYSYIPKAKHYIIVCNLILFFW